MSDITGPIGPREKKMYEQEYKHSADLFKRALDQYNKSENPYQKAEFKDVMDKAMTVLNETAHGLMRKELEDQNKKIANDYANFQKYPGDPDTLDKLNSDLDKAKKSV
ncbi:MAG: hypothetical protein K1X28_05605 [Parachlamydiales bacterium]|nr:hypothetical protein [Parachlamydiales bacterium]